MALINHRTREIHFKIVYYGCGLCGKTTNLKSLHDKLPAERRGKLISIATDHERTLFFDFLPIDLGQVNGFLTRFHLYTVPGQVYYKLSRRAVLQGVDGLIFVADSHPSRDTANRDSLVDLHDHLRTLGITGPALARIPWVFQYNKRDVPLALPLERLRETLNPQGWPEFEAVASDGRGVSESLRAMCKAVLARLATGTVAPTHATEATPAAVPSTPHIIAVPPPPVAPAPAVAASAATPAAAPRPAAAAPSQQLPPPPSPVPARKAAPARPNAPRPAFAPTPRTAGAPAAPYRSPRFPMPRPLTAAPGPRPAAAPTAPPRANPAPPSAPRPGAPVVAPGPGGKPRQL